jgi:major type 1 subunit fimbrin (pilin)
MNMFRNLMLLATIAIASQVANAADGTITFNGVVLGTTCSVNAGSPNLTVVLPTVSISSFNGIGSTAGNTPFKLVLTNCPAVLSGYSSYGVSAYFDQTNVNTSTGNLKNSSAPNAATGIEVQLLNSSKATMNLGLGQANATAANATLQNSTPVTISNTSTSATLDYSAQYYSNATTLLPGVVSTQVAYTIVYN